MKKYYFIFWIIGITTITVKAQNKTILGDTLFDYISYLENMKKLKLKDFNTSQDDFNFRFKNHGQIVELNKKGDSISGILTNYISRTKNGKNSKRDTLLDKTNLKKEEALDLLKIVYDSNILSLPSSDKIEKWSNGFDGITYTFEHANKDNYWYKKYWTPTSQDSIPESLIVLNLVSSITDTLKLKNRYKNFKEDLPHRGCYSTESIFQMCYIGNSIDIGYLGSTKLPFGYITTLNFSYIGNIKANFGIQLNHRFDNNKNSDLEFTFGKSNLFILKGKRKDFLIYKYRNRHLNFVNPVNSFKNHKFYYGQHLKRNFSLGLGFDHLNNGHNSFGGLIYASKWFKNPKINFSLITSVFEKDVDYKITASKSININDFPIIKNLSVELNLENFRNYTDFGFGVSFWVL